MAKESNDIAVSGENARQAYTLTISLTKEIRAIQLFPRSRGSEDLPEKTMHAISNLFKKEVTTRIKEQGYIVNEQEDDKITASSNQQIDAQKIYKDSASSLTKIITQLVKNEENIKNLGNSYKGDQLEQEISKLLNADLQKENINSNSTSGQAAALPRTYVREPKTNGVATGNSRFYVQL